MDDPCRNGVQTFAETGTEVGESCAVGACGTAKIRKMIDEAEGGKE